MISSFNSGLVPYQLGYKAFFIMSYAGIASFHIRRIPSMAHWISAACSNGFDSFPVDVKISLLTLQVPLAGGQIYWFA